MCENVGDQKKREDGKDSYRVVVIAEEVRPTEKFVFTQTITNHIPIVWVMFIKSANEVFSRNWTIGICFKGRIRFCHVLLSNYTAVSRFAVVLTW